tara:strand:+ start:8040 stop:8654 length:615 start_codon:yes stop_codon:yes gene_type:complete
LARKTKENSQLTRDLILDAAEHVIVKKGMSNTTMANIAEACNLSRGAVYGHYKGKVELAIAMVNRAMEGTTLLLKEHNESALTYLKRYCLNELHCYADPGSLQRTYLILYIRADDTPELIKIRQELEKSRAKVIDECVREAVIDGELNQNIDIDLTTLYIQSLIDGVFSVIFWAELHEGNKWETAEKLCALGFDGLVSMSTTQN